MLPPNTKIVISREDIPLPKDIEKEAGTLIMDGFFRGKIIPGYTHECSWIFRDKKMACRSEEQIANPLTEPAVIIDQIVQQTPFPLQNFSRANRDPFALSAMFGSAGRKKLLPSTWNTVSLLAKIERGLFREKLTAGSTIAVKMIFWKQ
jgi:hypothetical protein